MHAYTVVIKLQDDDSISYKQLNLTQKWIIIGHVEPSKFEKFYDALYLNAIN